MLDRELWMDIRRGLLTILDAIERVCVYEPRTGELRKEYDAKHNKHNEYKEKERIIKN